MSTIKPIITELREKKLLPVVGLLVLALIAIPLLLSKGGSSSSPPATPSASVPPPSPSTALPAVSVTPAPERPLRGRSRNPFKQIGATAKHSVTVTAKKTTAAVGSTSTASGSSSTSSSATNGASGASTTSSGGSSSGSSGGSVGGSSTPTIPVKPVKPAPVGLTPTQSYSVTLAITTSSGGLNTIDPLERLSALPNDRQPLLVELGVLQGGKKVLFLVQPRAVVNGPGTCLPGPTDCEILELGQQQIESLGVRLPGGVQALSDFAVTGITAANHGSVAAAQRARRQESAFGRALVNSSTSTALSLFPYVPSLGVIVDQRNVTVGGN
jgi:hypothetical protein